MIRNHEDEFIAVRVQDPRHQNDGSWNSYVDYKIFLHTNSKAFTAKTSCVRRRYSEFVWLKKNMQKNAGLVPVPDLPGKSFFSFNNEDFLERRRKGLQTFLHAVLHMTVFLSESLLHLFLQTQLPVSHIQDCVQGHTPYTVTDAILTYASSNRGLAQAQTQEDDVMKEPSLITVSYESMESPVLHVPTPPYKSEASPPGLPSPSEPDPPEALVKGHSVDLQLGKTKTSSVKVRQGPHHLEAIVEQHSPMGATFYLGETPDDRACEVRTPVEVRSPMGCCCEDGRRASEESSGRPVDPGPEAGGDESDEVASASEVHVEIHNVNTADGFHDIDVLPDHLEQTLAGSGEVDSVRNGREEGCDDDDNDDDDSQSSSSSDGSIAKISDEEECITDEREATTQNANVYSSAEGVIHMTDAESSSSDILRLETNCYSLERGSILSADYPCMETNGVQDAKGEELLYISDIGTLAKALDLESSSRPNGVGDFSNNGELCSPVRDYEPESVSGECSEQVTQPSSVCLESSE